MGATVLSAFKSVSEFLRKKENSRAVVSSCISGSSKIFCLIKTIVQ